MSVWKIFNDALNLRLIRSREPFIRSVIVQLLAPLAAKGGGELISELAIQLPIQVISGMLGLQEHTTSRIRTITEQLWMTFGKERDPAPLRELLAPRHVTRWECRVGEDDACKTLFPFGCQA